MPYYQGDFYRGDYYEGDPGIGSFFRKAVGFGASFVPGLGGIAARIGARAGQRALPAAAGVASTGIVRRVAGVVAPGAAQVGRVIAKHPVISAAAAAGALTMGTAEVARMGMVPQGMRGYHIEKKGKHAGQLIRNRHMRVTNPKALRRALRRAQGFAKLAMRTIHIVHPRKKGRFGGFKKRRAKR